MTMTAEQLAQQYDLLIANGQLTADTLIALSENEIDSDYFAVTSTNEARGTEVECELSITEFALRASENVRALLDELERKDKQATQDFQIKARLCRESNSLHDRLREADKRIAELEEQLRREQDYHLSVDLERMELWKKLEARTVTVKLPQPIRATALGRDFSALQYSETVKLLRDAGINLTVEG